MSRTLLLLATLTAAISARADVTGSYDGTLTPKKTAASAASAVFTQTDTAVTGTVALPAELEAFGGAYIVQGKATAKRVKVTGVGANGVKLKYRGKELVRRRDNDSITLGRDESSGLQILEDKCSRHHCTIERRGDKFVLRDHSTNGTYITIGEEEEILLQRDEIALRKSGWISFGQTRIGYPRRIC